MTIKLPVLPYITIKLQVSPSLQYMTIKFQVLSYIMKKVRNIEGDNYRLYVCIWFFVRFCKKNFFMK